jgi:hypothetical protein
MDYPLRQFSERIPSLPGHPLYCPECLFTHCFPNEEDRDLHYFQYHILNVSNEKLPNRAIMIDEGNYDGPLGEKRHVFPARRYVQEPESFLAEEEMRENEEVERRLLEEFGVFWGGLWQREMRT